MFACVPQRFRTIQLWGTTGLQALGAPGHGVQPARSPSTTSINDIRVLVVHSYAGSETIAQDGEMTSGGEFMPREMSSTGPLSPRAGLEGSWLERQRRIKGEVRSETQPHHGGAPHRAHLPSR